MPRKKFLLQRNWQHKNKCWLLKIITVDGFAFKDLKRGIFQCIIQFIQGFIGIESLY